MTEFMKYLGRGVAALCLVPFAGGALAQDADVRVLLTSEFSTIDPTEMSSELPMVMYHLYCRLYAFDENMVPQPDLVEEETVSDDNLTWTLKLREGATFHDGTPVDAEAVKYTIDRMMASSGSSRILFEPISGISIVDDHTVELTTTEPFPALRNNLASPYAGLVSREADERLGDRYGLEPVSCGPFRFRSWTRGTEVVVDRFGDYYGNASPYASITFQFVPDVSTRLFMMMNNEADIALRFGPMEAQQLRERDVTVEEALGRMIFYQLNYGNEPTNDIRVRKAINHAVDKQAIIDNVLAGGGVPAESVIGSNVFGGVPVGSYDYDPDKARELLREAGVTSASLTLYVTQNRYFNDSLVAQAIAGYLREVGLETDVNVIGDWAAYVEEVGKLDFHLFTLSWASSTGDPDQVMQALFNSERAGRTWNFGAFHDDEIDALIDNAKSVIDDDERKVLYAEIQERLFEEAPWLFMYRAKAYMALGDRITTMHVLEGPEFPYLFDLPN